MSRSLIAAALAAMTFFVPVQAQSPSSGLGSVSIFGSLDAGITYISNAGGRRKLEPQDGINKSNSLGFAGSEDLGGGRRAIFKLESGFSVDTGQLGQGGASFGKQAWVGLADATIGELMLGRQYDYGITMLRFLPCASCGIHGVENADLDRVSGQRLNNSVQFMSRRMGGFNAGLLYSAGEDSGAQTTNLGRAVSATLQYGQDGFAAGAYYTRVDRGPVFAGMTGAPALLGRALTPASVLVVDRQDILGAGAVYGRGAWRMSAVLTQSRFTLAGRRATDRVLHLGGDYRVAPQWVLATKLAWDRLEDSSWLSWSGGVDWLLSRRTDLYLDMHAQRASGEGTRASIAMAGVSSSRYQALVRLGIKHLF